MTRSNRFFFLMTCALSIVMICFYIRALYPIYLFPIYPDEVAERLALSRMVYDFPIRTNLMPMCKAMPQYYSKIWYFPSSIEWLLHGQIYNLKNFRVISIVSSWLVFLLLTMKLCKKNLAAFDRPNQKRMFIIIALGLVLALLQVGVVPFFLITLRSEQTILILLMIICLLFSEPTERSSKKIIMSLSYFMCVSLLLYLHPKTLLLVPILLIVAWRLFSRFNNKYIFTGLFFALTAIIFANYYLRLATLDCSNSIEVSQMLSGFSINFSNIIKNPTQFLHDLQYNLSDYKIEIDRISFQSIAQVNYLPPITMSRKLVWMNTLITINYWAIFFFTLTSGIVFYVRDLIKHKKIVTDHLLVLVILGCAVINVSINQCKNWYDAGFLWSLLVIAFIILIANHLPFLLKRMYFYVVICYFLLFGTASLYFLIQRYEPPLKEGFYGPSISLVKYDYDSINNELSKLASLCHIDVKKAQNLIIDDLTYFYFQKNKYPLAYSYLFYGNDRSFLHQFLNKFNPGGIVVRSTTLPAPLIEKYAIKRGEFICVPKENLTLLFKEILKN